MRLGDVSQSLGDVKGERLYLCEILSAFSSLMSQGIGPLKIVNSWVCRKLNPMPFTSSSSVLFSLHVNNSKRVKGASRGL